MTTPSLPYSQNYIPNGLLSQQLAELAAARCPDCSELLDTDHQRRHSLFILVQRDAEENQI